MNVDERFRLDLGADIEGPIVRPTGVLDVASCPQLDRCLRELTSPIVTVDFSSVTSMDSAAVEVLAHAQQRMRDEARKLVMYGLTPSQLGLVADFGFAGHFDAVVPN